MTLRLDNTPIDPAAELAENLRETKPAVIRLLHRVITALGADIVRQLAERTEAIEAGGGLLVRTGSRRRTRGGVFLYLVKQYLTQRNQQRLLRRIFPYQGKARREYRRTSPTPAPIKAVRRRVRGATSAQPEPPTRAEILAVLDELLGDAGDIYKRSIVFDYGKGGHMIGCWRPLFS